MSGPIGVVSHKIALHAGLLLISARIDLHSVVATIDPSAPATLIDPTLAQYVDAVVSPSAPQHPKKRRIIGLDHAETRLPQFLLAPTPAPIRLVIGADVLRDLVITIDLARSSLRVLDSSEYGRIGRGMLEVPVSTSDGDGCLKFKASYANGGPIDVALVGQPDGPQVTSSINITVSGISLPASPQLSGGEKCQSEAAIISWSAFRNHRVTLDLPHQRLWIRP